MDIRDNNDNLVNTQCIRKMKFLRFKQEERLGVKTALVTLP